MLLSSISFDLDLYLSLTSILSIHKILIVFSVIVVILLATNRRPRMVNGKPKPVQPPKLITKPDPDFIDESNLYPGEDPFIKYPKSSDH